MLELRNSKKVELARARNGRRRFALNGFIGAVQMLDPMEGWVDIKPRLVRVVDGWEVQGAPYYSKYFDDGSLLFCPDKYEKSKYLKVMGNPLWSKLAKKVLSAPIKIDKTVLPSIISVATEFGEIKWHFTNTGDKLSIIFNQLPLVAAKVVDRLTLDIDYSGLDIAKLLQSKEGLGIPQPRLMEQSDNPEAIQKFMDWNLKAGQLEVPLSFEGMKYPVVYHNSPLDVNVADGTDDCYYAWAGVGYQFLTNSDRFNAGAYSSIYYDYRSAARFDGITIPNASTIDVAYLVLVCSTQYDGTDCRTKIRAEAIDNANTFSTQANYEGRSKTAINIDWDISTVWTVGNSYYSDSIVPVIQVTVDRVGWVSGNALVIFWDNDSSPTDARNLRRGASWDNVTYDPPSIHIEWTEGGGGEIYDMTATDFTTIEKYVAELELTKSGVIESTMTFTINVVESG